MASIATSTPSRRWEFIVLLVLFAIVAISRFKFWQISFWEWDEVLYANALHRFNLWEHSPHPPGYPGYVAVTRCVNYFLHNDVKALTFTNAFFGSLLVFPLYFLYLRVSSRKVALGATILLLCNPMVWFWSETAYSDATSLFWAAASLAFLYHYENNRWFYLGMLSMGIAMSIRPQNVLFGLFLAPLFLWRKVRQGEIKTATIGLAILVATCLTWFVPLIRSVEGLQRYIDLMQVYGAAVSGDRGYLTLRHEMSLYAFIKTAFDLMWGNRHSFAMGMMGLTVLGVVVYLWRGNRRTFLLLMLGFLPMILVTFLFLDLYVPKYNMPTVVISSFFVVYGLFELVPRYPIWGKLLAPLVVIGFIVLSIHDTLPAVRYMHTVQSPFARWADYVHQHLDPKTDVIIFDPRTTAFPPYYLPEFTLVSQLDVDESKVEMIQDMNWYYVGFPLSGIIPQVQFPAGDDPIRQSSSMSVDLWFTKTDILYGNEYGSLVIGDIVYERLLKPTGHCFVKNNGSTKILSLEGKLLPPGPHAIPVHVEFDGRPILDTQVQPKERFDRFIILKPYEGIGPYSDLTIKTAPSLPGEALNLEAVYWWDIDPALEPKSQVIDFKPEEQPLLLAGWQPPEQDGELTVAKSEGVGSILRVPMKPHGIYELSFRVFPAAKTQEPDRSQAIAVCLGDTCSPLIELVKGEWRTYTRLVLSPATPADENVELYFNYRLMSCPSGVIIDTEDSNALVVAFDYVKLTWLGNLPVKTSHPSK